LKELLEWFNHSKRSLSLEMTVLLKSWKLISRRKNKHWTNSVRDFSDFNQRHQSVWIRLDQKDLIMKNKIRWANNVTKFLKTFPKTNHLISRDDWNSFKIKSVQSLFLLICSNILKLCLKGEFRKRLQRPMKACATEMLLIFHLTKINKHFQVFMNSGRWNQIF
jgi:glucan phosphorylase